MISRSFLSGAVALLGRKAIAVRDRMATRPAAPAPRAEPTDEAARRDHAMARFILRRVGIAPLAPAIALLFALVPFDGATAQSAPVRAAASARATILPASASLRQGRVIVTDARAGSTHPIVQPIVRACDRAPSGLPATPATCRMIVYDLP